MRHVEDRFHGAGGVEIYCQSWLPAQEPRAVIVLAHGLGEHSGRYGNLVERIVPAGYAVHALDHRGHGHSGGPRALIDRIEHALVDLDTIVSRAGDRPILFGHSMGATLALAYALRHEDRVSGLLLSSPLATLDAGPPLVRAAARALSAVAPRVPMIAVDSSGLSRDPAVIRAYREDPLVFHGRLPVRTIAELVKEVATFPARMHEVKAPLLIVHGTEDPLVPIGASEMVLAGAMSGDKALLRYEGCYHELFNELQPDRGRALDDVVAWLDARSR